MVNIIHEKLNRAPVDAHMVVWGQKTEGTYVSFQTLKSYHIYLKSDQEQWYQNKSNISFA